MGAHRDTLRGAGILFPDTGGGVSHGRLFKPARDAETGTEPDLESAPLWRRLRQDLDGAACETCLISYESLFHEGYSPQAARIVAALRGLFDRIDVVCYLRDPVAFGFSNLQQKLKSQASIAFPAPDFYSRNLRRWEESGADSLAVLAFDRAQFPGGDFLSAFGARHLGLDRVPRPPENRKNETLSAEAQAVLQAHFEAPPGPFSALTRFRLKAAIRDADMAVPGWSKPRPQDPVAAALWARCTDVDWLAARYGIRFAPPRIAATVRPADLAALTSVEEVMQVDPERARRVQALFRKKTSLWSLVTG